MKKSLILHLDSLLILDEISDEQAGKLFKAIKNYHSNSINELDEITKLIFIPFKNQFVRDEEKYINICNKNKTNGLKGGRPKTQVNPNEPKKANGLIENPNEPKKADSKNDSDSKSENKNDNKNNKKNDNKIFTPPTLEEVKIYFLENNYSETAAKKMFDYYSVANWHDSKGNKIKNWKQKAQSVWFKDENKISEQQILKSQVIVSDTGAIDFGFKTK